MAGQNRIGGKTKQRYISLFGIYIYIYSCERERHSESITVNHNPVTRHRLIKKSG